MPVYSFSEGEIRTLRAMVAKSRRGDITTDRPPERPPEPISRPIPGVLATALTASPDGLAPTFAMVRRRLLADATTRRIADAADGSGSGSALVKVYNYSVSAAASVGTACTYTTNSHGTLVFEWVDCGGSGPGSGTEPPTVCAGGGETWQYGPSVDNPENTGWLAVGEGCGYGDTGGTCVRQYADPTADPAYAAHYGMASPENGDQWSINCVPA